ncbi:MAG: hypothetical protein V4474_00060 [Patescibacteria group bacterium]
MIKIIPAVLPKSWGQLTDDLNKLVGVATMVQLDVVKNIFDGHESPPLWEEFDFEFDIYLEPGEFVERALELGASRIVVHTRHATARAALELLQPQRGGEFAMAVGVALRPTDTPDVLIPYAGLYDFVQVMGIDHEGNQGEPFDSAAISLVRALRTAQPELFIQVDGHAAGHEQELAAAGVNSLVVGSAILTAEDPKAAYRTLYNKANGSH